MGDRKSVLIVEDDMDIIKNLENELGNTYNITSVYYEDDKTLIPRDKFDAAIIDGLRGKYREVGNQVNADKKIIFSQCLMYVGDAEEGGYIDGCKTDARVYDKLVEIIEDEC